MAQSVLRKGERVTLIAWGVTFFFSLAKGAAGFISGSVVLLADAVHSFADSFSTLVAFAGLKIAQKKPSRRFPFGYYKAENIASFLISALILYAAYEIARESFDKILAPYQIHFALVAMAVAILDALFMFIVGTFEVRMGRQINSQSLIADGNESRMHLVSSSVVLIGLLSSYFRLPYIEGSLGLLLSLFVAGIGLKSLRDSLFALMDVSPSREIEEKVKMVLRKVSGIQGFEQLRLRRSGPFVFGQVKVKIRKSLNIAQSQEIAALVEAKIKQAVSSIDSFVVSFIPFQLDKQKICFPVDIYNGLKSELSQHLGRAERFLFATVRRGRVEDFYVKENIFKDKEIRAGLAVANFIIKEKVDAVVTNEIGEIAFHTLRNNIVDIYKASGSKRVSRLVKEFSGGKLPLLKTPTIRKH